MTASTIIIPKKPNIHSFLICLMLTLGWAFLVFYANLRWDQTIEKTLTLGKKAETLARSTILMDPDGMEWVLLSQKAEQDQRIRIPRWTDLDNYPHGRSVMWPSFHSLWLRGLGHVHSWITGASVETSIARASAYSNPAYLLLFSLPIAFLSMRTFGLWGALLYPVILLLLQNPKYGVRVPDHHVLHLCIAVVFLLSILRLTQHQNKRDWIFSGMILGGFYWISALSAVIITLATLLPMPLLLRGRKSTSTFHWFLWSASASCIILLCYLLDYAPHFSIHLECANPIYAALLLCGTPLIPQWIRFSQNKLQLGTIQMRMALYPLLLLSAWFFLILLNLSAWYTPSHPFLARWMTFITESTG